MAKLLKMLWEYMDLTVLPFFETWSAHIFGGWQRVCWCTNEAFNQASPTKEFWENCPQKKGGHIYGKNEGWAYLRKLLYTKNMLWKVWLSWSVGNTFKLRMKKKNTGLLKRVKLEEVASSTSSTSLRPTLEVSSISLQSPQYSSYTFSS